MSRSKTILEESHSYISSAVADAHSAYLSNNPISANAHRNATEYMPGGNTRTVLHSQPFPLSIKSGSGSRLTSVDGRTYVDFLGEYSAGLFGHSNPLIEEALNKAIKCGWNFGGETLHEKELARKITTRFSGGGAAIAWTGRKKILVFSNGYHGGTLIFTMENCKWSHSKMSTAPPLNINLPHEFVMAPFNNLKETKVIVDGLPKDSLAAIMVEPVQGTTEKLGALFIVDEVMTSRLGPSGYLETLGLKADLMTLGKWIGGGMSFGAFGGRRDIMGLFDPARSTKGLIHAGTFNNNVFSMSTGVVALDIYDEQKVKEFNARGDRMKYGVTRALFETGLYSQEHANYLKDIREIDSFEEDVRLYTGNDEMTHLPKVLTSGYGTMLNLRFTGPDAGSWHNIYYHFMLQKGIYLASRGYTPMNLEITDEDVDMFVSSVKEFLTIHVDELRKG